MKVKDNTKIFIRICLAIILVAVAFLVYKLHFKGSDVEFISNINENYTIKIEKETAVFKEGTRIHTGDKFTIYELTGKQATEFQELFSAIKMRRLLRSVTQIKHVEDFVYYRIYITSDTGEEYIISTFGDYVMIDNFYIGSCEPITKTWREALDEVMVRGELISEKTELPLHMQ